MRNAITLIELILVLVIIGIIYIIGAQSVHPRHLENDANFIKLKIMTSQYQGLNFDHRDENGSEITQYKNIGCIKFTKESLNDSANNGKSKYKISSDLQGELANQTICFDHLGRPSLNDHLHPIKFLKNLTLEKNGKEMNISIYPRSGYVIIINK